MARHNEVGKQGELIAQKYVAELGYVILEANWQEQKYEIDIIAQDGQEIVFIEVKTRSTDYFGNPKEAVNIAKQKHLIEGANYYLEDHQIDLEARFDVMAIIIGKQERVEHIKYAFYPEG